jgi:hypothetical protein
VSQLLPEGITSLADCPFTIHTAILAALGILNYREFPIDERPPKRIWMSSEKLDEWWTEVERKREAKYKDKGQASGEEYDGPVQENKVELIARG